MGWLAAVAGRERGRTPAALKRARWGRSPSPEAAGKPGLAATNTSGSDGRALAPRAGGRGSGPEEDSGRAVTVPLPEDAGPGRTPSMGHCRLCHGKFSSWNLRHIFVPASGGRREEQAFCVDFQRLLGVPILQDPALPRGVCKNCHSQFYKCHSVLSSFLQRVNAAPPGHRQPRGKSGPDAGAQAEVAAPTPARPQCQRSEGWTHGHAGSCGLVAGLQDTPPSEPRGVIQAAWGSDRGHVYTMETGSHFSAPLLDHKPAVKREWDEGTAHRLSINSAAVLQSPRSKGPTVPAGTESLSLPNTTAVQPPLEDNPAGPEPDSPPESRQPPDEAQGQWRVKQVSSSALNDRVKGEFSDLSGGDFLSHKNDNRSQSSEPCPEKKPSGKMSGSKAKESDEHQLRKKPAPKPSWKKVRCEREEQPTIYKCPYQGCTAVSRGADGMKKHIKEHHEELRERPCPHPGCNKVFMIDRYLQRHVKLIHTEVRNYICDECGQRFKQRKHLSVHQLRHSGAKPLQCEICGFQCRQRASMKYHMTKHKAEAELEFACDQCGRRFEKAHNLNIHMSVVHPLTLNQDKAKALLSEQPTGLMNPSGRMESKAAEPELLAQQEPT